jgi:uncharacterized protein YgiM (DUF1202 family)
VSANEPPEPRPLSLKQLVGISLITFLVGFLLLELVDPRWIGALRPAPGPANVPTVASAPAKSASAPRRKPVARASASPTGASANATGQPAVGAVVDEGPVAGQRVTVVETDGLGVNLRASPSDESEALEHLPEGAVAELTGQSSEIGDQIWVEVRIPDGKSGWIAADYLAEASSR